MAFSAPGPDEARTAGEPGPSTASSSSTTGTTGATEHPRSPLLAALGAGEAAFTAVARTFAEAFGSATSTQKTVQQRVAELPTELEELRARFSGDELRRALEAYRAQVERAYSVFAERGEETWGRLRERPQVRQAITTLESYGGKLDGRVEVLVDDAQDAATRALAAAGRQTRVTGEKVARAGQRFSGRAADAVVDASAATSEVVEETGAAAAGAIEDAGDGTAEVTRRTTRKAAPRRAPRRSGPASE